MMKASEPSCSLRKEVSLLAIGISFAAPAAEQSPQQFDAAIASCQDGRLGPGLFCCHLVPGILPDRLDDHLKVTITSSRSSRTRRLPAPYPTTGCVPRLRHGRPERR